MIGGATSTLAALRSTLPAAFIRHPSESWGIHGAGGVIANRDTPAFAGVTGFGVARGGSRATSVGAERGK